MYLSIAIKELLLLALMDMGRAVPQAVTSSGLHAVEVTF
jgi:hypothetical protein